MPTPHILAVDRIDGHGERPFALYEHDPRLANQPGHIDMRGLIRQGSYRWLDEVSNELSLVMKRLSGRSRWAWCLPAARLDARPWGQADILKPLLFARALGQWLEENRQTESVRVCGAPTITFLLLADLYPALTIQTGQQRRSSLRARLKDFLRPYVHLFRRAAAILSNHVTVSLPVAPDKMNLVLCQPVGNTPVMESHRYFFTTLFDGDVSGQVSLGVLGVIQPDQRPGVDLRSTRCIVLDWCRLADCVVGSLAALRLLHAVRGLHKDTMPTPRTVRFWQYYLSRSLDFALVLDGYCTYHALKRLFHDSPVRQIIYPYEEKGFERALLFACSETGRRTIGFCPHPQHQLAVALRDQADGGSPKPDAYAFCGAAYVPVFRTWGRKATASMTVWGTGKARRAPFNIGPIGTERIRLLVLVSHPSELNQLQAWLAMTPELIDICDIHLRLYKADDMQLLDQRTEEIKSKFPFISITEGTLAEDLAAADLTAFCATSAGPEAILFGRLSLFIDLNDSFAVNAFFDDDEAFLPCATPNEFYNRLTWLRSLGNQDLVALFAKQRRAAERLFSPIDTAALIQSLEVVK